MIATNMPYGGRIQTIELLEATFLKGNQCFDIVKNEVEIQPKNLIRSVSKNIGNIETFLRYM